MVGAFISGVAAATDVVGVFVLDAILKATVLLILACVAAGLLRRASAAVRHRVWCLAFLGLVLLPVVLLALPGWRLPVLPGLAISPAAPHESPSAEATAVSLGREDAARTDRSGDPADFISGQDPVMASLAALATSDGDLAALPNPEPRDVGWVSDPSRTAWKAILPMVWLIGLAWALLPIAVSPIYKRILVKSARPVVDREPGRLLTELCRSLNVRRPVRVLEIDRPVVPMTWGLLRPIVLLPLAWREWPLERQRIVLLHELAHVKRLDPTFQLLARLACALYWFHPLAWYALRRLRIERESACDDCVLLAGEMPSEYAQQLLAIARDYRAAAVPVAVAMAQSTRLERRVRAFLDQARSHLPVSRGAGRVALIFAALILMGVSMVGPAGTSERQKEDTASSMEESSAASVEPMPLTALAGADAPARPTETKTPAAPPAAAPAGGDQAARRDPKPDDTRLEYRGQVVDPDGKPVAGAKIFLCYWVPGAPPDYVPKPRAVTDKEGRFAFATTRADFEPNAGNEWKWSTIVAAAEGYGFAADASFSFETTGKAVGGLSAEALSYFAARLKNPKRVLQLVRDDVPIQARVTTADGKPVAGARIRVNEVWYTEAGDLTAFEKAAKDPKADYYSLRRQVSNLINGPHLAAVVPLAETDKDGRFTLRGVGRERIAQFLVRGAGIECKLLKARTRQGDTIVVPHEWRFANRREMKMEETFYGARFDYVAGPSKPVVGRVTDVDTGKPIPGVLVNAGQEGTFFRGGLPFVATVTDAEGRYRLDGMPVTKRNDLNAFPPKTSAYLPAGRWLNTQVAEPSVTHDFRLKQGIWVRGRAVDDRTGKPAPGRVQYYAFKDNPNTKSFPEALEGGVVQERRTDDDGRFEIAVMPGPGLIVFMALDHTRYRRSSGVETITGPTVNMGGDSKVFATTSTYYSASDDHVLRQINPEPGSKPIELTLMLTSGVDVSGYVLDPEEKRLSGYNAYGNIQQGWYPVRAEEFRVEGYYPDRPRDLYFFHPARDLAGFYRLEGTPPKRLVVTLQPAGSVRGRVVDDNGRPLASVKLFGEGVPSEDYGDTSLRLGTDQDGRFLIRGLIPGRKYTIAAAREGMYGYSVAKDVTVEDSKTKELGDVKLEPDNRGARPSPAPPPKRPSKPQTGARNPAAGEITVRGTVLLPDGRPATGATVRAATAVWAMLEPIVGKDAKPPSRETKTDSNGQFVISFTTQPYGDLSRLDPFWSEIWKKTEIAASAPGYGPAWLRYEDIQADKPLVLRLVPDLPIRGRIVDPEGKPVARLAIKISNLAAAASEDLTPWLTAAKAGELPWTLWKHTPKQLNPELVGVPTQVATDPEGRFEIRGVGRERHLDLTFTGETVAHQTIGAATRKMEPIDRIISTPPLAGTERVFGAEFTFTATPSIPIVGTVRDAKSGQALAGVSVESYLLAGYPYANHRVLKTASDQQGRFRLTGMPKGNGNRLLAVPNDEQPYLMREIKLPDLVGPDPLSVDIALHRGLWITGRVTDKATGQPVRARLHYLPFRSNEFVRSLPEFDEHGNVDGDQKRYQTREDGSYRLVGLPGRALVGAESVLRQYRTGAGSETIQGLDKHGRFDTYHNPVWPGLKWPNVMKEINPPADAQSVTVDLEMDPGRSVRISMVDPQGQPIAGVEVYGVTSHGDRQTMSEPAFEVANLSPGEVRTITFHHKVRKLGCVLRLKADEAGPQPISVRLQPVGTLQGRLLHPDGAPATGTVVEIGVLPGGDFSKRLPPAATDVQGRFECTLLPGAAYYLQAQGAGIDTVAEVARDVSIAPGQLKDLGDVTLRRR